MDLVSILTGYLRMFDFYSLVNLSMTLQSNRRAVNRAKLLEKLVLLNKSNIKIIVTATGFEPTNN